MRKCRSKLEGMGGLGQSTAYQVRDTKGITSGRAYRIELIKGIFDHQAEVIHSGFRALCKAIL